MDKPHKKLEAWKQAMDLAVEVYRVTENFPADERFGLTGQARRSAVSVPCNIAEGTARQSRKELLNFLSVARGSLSELDTLCELSQRLGYLASDEAAAMDVRLDHTGRLLSGLIRHHRKRVRSELRGVSRGTE